MPFASRSKSGWLFSNIDKRCDGASNYVTVKLAS